MGAIIYKKRRLNEDDPTSRWLQDKMTDTLKTTTINNDEEAWDPETQAPWM
jgi:hypothetical protein